MRSKKSQYLENVVLTSTLISEKRMMSSDLRKVTMGFQILIIKLVDEDYHLLVI